MLSMKFFDEIHEKCLGIYEITLLPLFCIKTYYSSILCGSLHHHELFHTQQQILL